jgi:hypothetical protein
MTDASGTYTFTARYIGETQLSLNVDPATGAQAEPWAQAQTPRL